MAGIFVVYVPTEEYERQLKQKKFGIQKNGNLFEKNPSLKPGNDRSSNNNVKDGEEKPLKVIVEEALEELNVTNVTWSKTQDDRFHQVVFVRGDVFSVDEVVDHLQALGIGEIYESSVSVAPCNIHFHDGEDAVKSPISNDNPDTKEATLRRQFIKSIKARLTVAQVVAGVRGGADITFDYLLYVILAGLIAAYGLMDSSSVSVVASMLVSPLMGPIMAFVFGLIIKDYSLIRIGFKGEAVGILLTIVVGFVNGLIFGPWQEAFERGKWPTDEMYARGHLRGLWVGLLIALPSGAGVALSVLGGNSSSLVGVAISASLLPPCVNAGLLWAYAIVIGISSIGEEHIFSQDYLGNNISGPPDLLVAPDYKYKYSTDMAVEAICLGAVSFGLTMVNILCIIISAIAVLKIKEFAPKASQPQTQRFWQEDIKIARDYNKTVQGIDSEDLGKAILKEWAALNNIDPQRPDANFKLHEIADIVQEAEEDYVYRTVMKAIPNPITTNQITIHDKPMTRRMSQAAAATEMPMNTEHKTSVWDIAYTQPNGRRRTLVNTDGLQTISELRRSLRHSQRRSRPQEDTSIEMNGNLNKPTKY